MSIDPNAAFKSQFTAETFPTDVFPIQTLVEILRADLASLFEDDGVEYADPTTFEAAVNIKAAIDGIEEAVHRGCQLNDLRYKDVAARPADPEFLNAWSESWSVREYITEDREQAIEDLREMLWANIEDWCVKHLDHACGCLADDDGVLPQDEEV